MDDYVDTSALGNLGKQHKALFCASCCQRMLPFYKAFEKNGRWTPSLSYEECLSMLWDFVTASNDARLHYPQHIEWLGDLMLPDEDADVFSDYFSAASVAVEALEDSFAAVNLNDIGRICRVSENCTELIDQYLSGVGYVNGCDNDEFQRWIDYSPLMLSEIECQKHDLLLLASSANLVDIVDAIKSNSLLKSPSPLR